MLSKATAAPVLSSDNASRTMQARIKDSTTQSQTAAQEQLKCKQLQIKTKVYHANQLPLEEAEEELRHM